MTNIERIENFIYSTEVHKIFSEINNNVMNFNILEIVGVGTQEIKHSNILSWMFSKNEHNLEYKILMNFLIKVADKNDDAQLKQYVYLSNQEKTLKIYRETDYIDILAVDDSNKVVIIIENKLYHKESKDQLKKYENIIDKKYKNYKSFFIFLTINLEKPSSKKWLQADYEMILEAIKSVIENEDLSEKTNLILTSYIDLLKRRRIVEDKKLTELCEKIWLNEEYKKALEILIANKTTKIDLIRIGIEKILEEKNIEYFDSYLKFDSLTRLYEYYGKKWEDVGNSSDMLIEVQLVFRKNSIWLGFWHPNIKNTDETITQIYRELTNKKGEQRETKIYQILEKNLNEHVNIEEEIKKLMTKIEETKIKLEKVIFSYIDN